MSHWSDLTNNKAPLFLDEKTKLRQHKIKRSTLRHFNANTLHELTEIPLDRCQFLITIEQFKALTSVGETMAVKLWRIGMDSMETLANADGSKLYLAYCDLIQHQADPCVEDVFLCAVAQANDPNLSEDKRNWWYWTAHRRVG